MGSIAELRSQIGAVRRRWRTLVAVRTAAIGSALATIPIAVGALAGWIAAPQGPPLIAIGALAVAGAAVACVAAVWRMPRRPSDLMTARFIEERAADLDLGRLEDGLVSAVQVSESPEADPFAGAVVAQAAARLREMPPHSIIPRAALRRSAAHAIAATTCLTLALVVARPMLGGAADAAWLALFPHSVTITVRPGNTRVAAGQPLRIRASLTGRGSALRGLAPSLLVSTDDQQRTVAMTPADGAYEFALESVDRSFTYRVLAAPVTSEVYSVTALFPPRVRRIDVSYEYPQFSGLAARTEEGGGDIYGPAGTRVRIRVHTDKPIVAGQLALAGRPAIPLHTVGDRAGEAALTLAKDDAYRIRLADTDGLRSNGETEYFIRLMDDRPPEVRVLRPSADQSVTPLEEVSIEARADDDYGISRFDLVYSVAGRQERTVPFSSVTGTNVARVGSYLLAAEDLSVQPGDVVTYYARAIDIGRGKRPSETRSDMFFLEVKPFGEEFVAAQSQAAGGGGAAAQIESLVAAQKEIITATWNLERRSQAGRSAADAKAVAQAQAELKTRAERMASSARRMRSPYAPQQFVRQPPPGSRGDGANPIAAAVESMTRAIDALEQQRLRDALPLEMAALRGLLQAQAEVRRRQVQQSASGAAQGGTNRMGQDLSALFDRELQRQQRTNYESRSQIEERPDADNTDSALDRIRDLARRQEDLSRRQRELSEAGLSEEALKRQLATLSREQEALRAQAEALERELGSKGSEGSERARSKGSERQGSGRTGSERTGSESQGSAGSERAGSGGSAGRAMRGAAEQMRQAAGEMQRRDARAAAERAREAGESLRRVEQQLRGNSAEALERAAGELQLEAQQVADAQRRIAADAARTQGAGATADAARRLAAEKDALADRVDALQQAAERLGAGARAGADPASRARDAGAMLERERVARRMRESAQSWRDDQRGRPGAGSERRAQNEQEIARAAERAAAALGGQIAGAALSEQLEQTRAMRERLNNLEQQIRDAESGDRAKPSGTSSRQGQPESEGPQGREGRQGSAGSGQAGELQRLRNEYARELRRTQEALGRMQGEPRAGQGMSTPETHEFSRSSPGTEAFKQDYTKWDTLRRDIDLAMERYEETVSRRIDGSAGADRLNAGGSDRIPDAYHQSIARYYQSLATLKK